MKKIGTFLFAMLAAMAPVFGFAVFGILLTPQLPDLWTIPVCGLLLVCAACWWRYLFWLVSKLGVEGYLVGFEHCLGSWEQK